MKILNGLGGFVASLMLLGMAASMIVTADPMDDLRGTAAKTHTVALKMQQKDGAEMLRGSQYASAPKIRKERPVHTHAAQ
jgi:hypothetical protein